MSRRSVARVVLALVAIGVCLLLMQSAARVGFSRLLSRYAVSANSLPAADQAIRLTPDDPEAHRARGVVLTRSRNLADAEASLETAASLRPSDAGVWLALGNTREELGDNDGALAAFNEAVSAAPYYGQTHWQRGNLLLRLERYDEAIGDLRQAATSDRRFLPNVIDLAWGLSGGGARRVEELIPLNDDRDRLEFARFLARKGKGPEVAEQIVSLDASLSEENKEELIRLLVASRNLPEAFKLWKGSETSDGFVNGMFEDPLVFDNNYFRWQISKSHPNVKFAIDVSEKFSGEKSLQVSFTGEWNPAAVLLSQTLVLEPGRYRINFAVKTKDLVTGGPPRIVITKSTNNQILGKSDPFPPAAGSWSSLGVEFVLPSTEAVDVGLVRDSCATSPCPIFGFVWLDEFHITKL
jgi:tetratricopeptide (TPR) repeat protein